MGRDPTEQAEPDLFSTNAVRDASPSPTATKPTDDKSSQRHILPKNLRHAVKHLSDGELDLMHAATLEEMKRRGRLPPSIETSSAPSSSRPSELVTNRSLARNKPQRRQVDVAEVSLTRGQINAVRAAFKAGITPSRIARQFGISQSNVRKALASDEPRR
jgi:DNA-binding CsgD family transcriptional regulator